MRIKKLTTVIGILMMAALFPITAMAGQPDEVVEEPADAPVIANSKKQGQWFKDMARETEVQYIFIGRPGKLEPYMSTGLCFGSKAEISIIEMVSSETSFKGRQTIQRVTERLSTIYPLEVVFQTRDEDDGSLVTISVVISPDNPDIATDILIYKWSKTFEVALVHLNGKFDITNAAWSQVVPKR